MADMEQISPGERLAREFEKWQKEYYDEVYAHFTQNNKTKGNAAFDGWQGRFLEYLEDNLPQKVNEYHVHLRNNTGEQRAMMSALENFRRTRGDAVESFLEQCIDEARKGNLDMSDADNFENAEAIIRSHCKKECPNDFDMRSYCEAQQRRAVNHLKQGAPEDIPKDIFMQIRIKCASEWPTDFQMRLNCEETQFETHRKLKSSN